MEYDKLFPDFPGQDGNVSAGFEDRVWKKIRRKKVERRIMASAALSLAVIAVVLLVPGKSGPSEADQAQFKQLAQSQYTTNQEEIAINAQLVNTAYASDGQYAVHPVVYKPRSNRY